MNRIREGIKKCMIDLSAGDDEGITARFMFPRDFIGFRGHFPARPVLPGVCMIQVVSLVIQEWKKKRGKLREIVQAKFFAPVTCGEELVCSCVESPGEGGVSVVRAKLTGGGKKVAVIHLKMNLNN